MEWIECECGITVSEEKYISHSKSTIHKRCMLVKYNNAKRSTNSVDEVSDGNEIEEPRKKSEGMYEDCERNL